MAGTKKRTAGSQVWRPRVPGAGLSDQPATVIAFAGKGVSNDQEPLPGIEDHAIRWCRAVPDHLNRRLAPGDAGASKRRSHAGAWERSKWGTIKTSRAWTASTGAGRLGGSGPCPRWHCSVNRPLRPTFSGTGTGRPGSARGCPGTRPTAGHRCRSGSPPRGFRCSEPRH